MLCLDIRSLIAYLQGEEGADVDLIDQALINQVGVLAEVFMSIISIKLPDNLLKTSTKLAELLCLSHTASIRRSIERMNRPTEQPHSQLSVSCSERVSFQPGRCARINGCREWFFAPYQERRYR